MENLRVNKTELKKELNKLGVSDLQKSHRLGEVYFMLSLDCNLRCRICSWWGKKGACRNSSFIKRQSVNLKFNDLKKFAEEIINFRPLTVTFSGGEPLLYKYWYPLAKYFKNHGIKVSLTTNGVRLAKEFRKITETVDEINLSLGGPPSLLPLIREDPIAHFTKIFRGLKLITKFKKKNNNKPRLRVLCTISDLSYKHLSKLIDFLQKNNIAIDQYYFQHLMFIDKKTFQKQKKIFSDKFKIKNLDIWQGYTYLPTKIDFQRFRGEINKVNKYPNAIFSPNLSSKELQSYYQKNKITSSYRKFCLAPWLQLNVLPNGDLYICNDYFIGNLKEGPFEKIWNGKKSQNLRKCISRELFPACKGCFNYYWERKR